MPEPTSADPTISTDDVTRVKGWVASADQRRKDFETLWDENAKRFQPPPSDLTKTRGRYDVNTNVDFRQVEQTKPQLFYATPDVQLEPTSPGRPMPVMAMVPPAPVDPNNPAPQPPTVSYDTAIAIHQLVLKGVLGPRPLGVDALRAVQAVLTDVLAISGIGWVEVGRELYTKDVETVDPLTGEPLVVKTPIYEQPFLSHFSPAKGLVPSDAVGSDPDTWSWIGRHWCRPVSELRQQHGAKIPDDFKGTARKDPHRLRADDVDRAGDVDLATGVTIWLRANLLDAAAHPLLIRELVLCDGIEEPLVYRDSPYQTFGEDGQLTPDSMVGFPIYPLILQDAPDSPYVLAQSSMTRPLVEELNLYRSQSLAHRDAGRPVMLVNASKMTPEAVDQMKAKGYSHVVFMTDEDWPVGQPPILHVQMPGLPRDNYDGGAVIERDIEKTHAISANQSGSANSGRRSATEIQTVQGNADVRTASLRGRAIDWYLKVVAKLDRGVVVRYAPEQQGKWVQVLGEQDAATWYQWNKQTLAGECLYRAKPDSQLFVDAAQDRAQFLQGYNLAAPSANFDRLELDRMMARKFNWPEKMVRPPQPSGPPPPKVSVAINTSDLNTPAAPIILSLLEQQGFKIDPQAVENMMAEKAKAQAALVAQEAADTRQSGQAPPRPKGDVAEKAASLDAHQERRTGGIEGIGTVQ